MVRLLARTVTGEQHASIRCSRCLPSKFSICCREAMELDQLAAFEKVAREGSFSRAALALGVGQPAGSARIQPLEAAVGGALFNRGPRIPLTARGGTSLPSVRPAPEVPPEGAGPGRTA